MGVGSITTRCSTTDQQLAGHAAQGEVQKPPDLFTEGGFIAAQMIVCSLEGNGDISADKMIPMLEGMKIDGPKGFYTVRASDHVLLQEMLLLKLKTLLRLQVLRASQALHPRADSTTVRSPSRAELLR